MPAKTLAKPSDRSADELALSVAVIKAANYWQLTNQTLGAILGLSSPTVSRMSHGKWQLEAGSKPFELAQQFVRVFRSLDSLMGSDDASARSWLCTPNTELEARPLELMTSIRGLFDVANYIDDYRAKV